jgi:hypothetical protein
MNKQQQIEAKATKPIEVGDYVKVTVPYTRKVTRTEGRGKKKVTIEENVDQTFQMEGRVIEVLDSAYKISASSISIPYELKDTLPSGYEKRYEQWVLAKAEYVKPTFHDCGSNPFTKEKRRISFFNQDLMSILSKMGYGRRSNDYSEMDNEEKEWSKVNFNPYVIDKNGNKQFYQRDLVWTQEQKQLLIDSIYNGIEIGKFLFRYNSWTRMEQEKKETGEQHSWDCVDGKQRLFAILEFLQNKYPDSYGNYWDDLSGIAQRRFLNYQNLSYGELPESATDEDVIENFLTLNFTGVPMSKEHIEYVKSFNMK